MKIDNLRKITVLMEIEGNQPIRLSCVFGIASTGLSSFELDLYQKSAGDILFISVPGTMAAEYFGHLFRQLSQQLNHPVTPQTYEAKVTIVAVEPSDEKEVVKAMAQSLGHSCGGGGCDCGCS